MISQHLSDFNSSIITEAPLSTYVYIRLLELLLLHILTTILPYPSTHAAKSIHSPMIAHDAPLSCKHMPCINALRVTRDLEEF